MSNSTTLPPSGLALPRVIAHRGGAGGAPENTLAAFRQAHAVGARWVEFDVRLTADGRPVVIHDATLDRTTSGRGAVAATPLAALGDLDAGEWFDPDFAGEMVPTLEEALDLLVEMDMGANIEIKAEPDQAAQTAGECLNVARDVWPANAPPPLISSFRPDALRQARDHVPQWPRGLLVEALTDDWSRVAASVEATSIHAAAELMTARQVAEVLDAGYRVVVYTVDDPGRAVNLWDWGVDAIISDRPEALLPLAGF